MAVAYKLDGEELSSYPADLDALERAEVVYKEFPGWQTSTTNCRTWYDLPKKARDYVEVRYLTWLGREVLILTLSSLLRSSSESRYAFCSVCSSLLLTLAVLGQVDWHWS